MAACAPPEGPSDQAVRAAWVRWCRAMRWDVFATPAVGHLTSEAAILRAVERWLRPFPAAYAVVGLQRGPAGGWLHPHALVGGIGRAPLRLAFLRDSWRHGSVHLDGYTPRKGAVEYVVAQADRLEILGTPRRYRPRRTAGISTS